jgi:uncharacterized protein involved in response to NO
MNITIEHAKAHDAHAWAVFRLGFRPFFLAAASMAVISMVIWMAELIFHVRLLPGTVPPIYWHAHEMIYGYTLAVIAGFLLTAVKNWTNIQTLHGWPLKLLLLLWVLARIVGLLPGQQALLAEVMLDNLFILYLSVALTVPVVQAKLWKNMGVISKLYFFLIGNVIYALGLFGLFHDGQRIGLFIGLYMILSLILVLSRRVMPMFIEGGVGYAVSLTNHLWVDIACFLLFLAFAVTDIFFTHPALTAWLAAALCLLHSIRLAGWHTRGIWNKPLLWALYLGYGWIILGFGLKFAAFMFGFSPSLAVHAFTFGGIGMMTLGMMSRISLGHTGRNIMRPPFGLGLMFLLLTVGAMVRVIFPLISAANYQLWIGISQTLWIAAFTLFLYRYASILIKPRMDGRWG